MTDALGLLLAILGAALALTLIRLVRGPSLADRVVALDLLAVIGVSLLAICALRYRQPAFLDVALLLGLVGFMSSVIFARTIEMRGGAGPSGRPDGTDGATETAPGESAADRPPGGTP